MFEETGKSHKLDSYENIRLFKKLYGYWHEARSAHADNRAEQAIDEDFYDNIQWDQEDINTLLNRGQDPIVFNEIKPAIDWIIGTENRTRVDWKVYPRTKDDRDSSEIKTKLLRYVQDANKMNFIVSKSFADAVKVGIGWLELGIRDNSEDEPLFIKHVPWREIWADPLHGDRYIIRSKVVDVDIARAMFPDRKDVIEVSKEDAFCGMYGTLYDEDLHDVRQYIDMSLIGVETTTLSNFKREVVRLNECWYKVPVNIKVVRGNARFNNQEFDPNNFEMVDAINNGMASIYESVRMQTYVAVFCTKGLLQNIKSPYRHNKYPFVPILGFIRGRDNMPYGVIRSARDPQREVNKRRSKALFLLSTNRTIMDEGAVEDLDHYAEEVAAPDGIIVKKPNKNLEIQTNPQLADAHINLGLQASQYIRHVSGVTGENQGLETNATSGKAILARQSQGTVITAQLFDNKRLAIQQAGEQMLSLVEQFYDYEKVVRITGTMGADEFLTINERMPDGNISNPIHLSQSDFKVSDQDSSETERQAQFDQLIEVIRGMDSSIAINFLDLAFELSDIPNADEFVKRLRQINGQVDPNDPNADQLNQQNEMLKQQKQQEQESIQKAQIDSEMRNREIRNKDAEMTRMDKALAMAEKIGAKTPEEKMKLANMLLFGADNAIKSV